MSRGPAAGGRQPNLGRQISAVIAREVRSRYTGDILGYGWAYVIPLAWIGLIYIVFRVMGRVSPLDSDIVSFILSGVLPYLSFRYQVTAAIRARGAWRHVMLLPGVAPATIHLAIALLELGNALLMYLVLMAVNLLLTGNWFLYHPLVWLFGFTLASGTGAALGTAAVSLARKPESAGRVMSVVLRPMFYLSPVYFLTTELPDSIVRLLAWNPLLHAIEIGRIGAFRGYQPTLASALMPLGFIVACLLVSLGRASRAEDDEDDTLLAGEGL